MKWRNPLRRCWPEALLVLLLALLPLLFFWRVVTPNPIDSMSIAAGDFLGQYYPLRALAVRALAKGQLPLWNPHWYAGQPALADIQAGVFYPPQAFQALLLAAANVDFSPRALEWQVLWHFSWATVGAYFLARRLVCTDECTPMRRVRCAGVVTALVFTYGGYLTSFPVQQVTILEVSAWLPWTLLAVDNLAAQNSFGWRTAAIPTTWTALTLCLALLAGHPQTWMYLLYTTLAFYLWRASTVYGPKSISLVRLWLRALGRPALGLLLALMLSAVQWVPTVELMFRSPRAAMGYQEASFGLPLHELVALIYPGYLGGSPQYVGILPLLLIGLAWAIGRPRHQIAFWSVLGALALLLSFGGNTFLYPLFYLVAPGFAWVRHQERAYLIYALCAAILSGYGAMALTAPLERARRVILERFGSVTRYVFFAALGSTFLFVYGSLATEQRDLFAGVLRHHIFASLILGMSWLLLALRARRYLARPWGMALLTGCIAFNLFTINWRFNLRPPADWFALTPAIEELREQLVHQPEVVRIASGGLLPAGPGAAAVYGFYDITGNSPLHLTAWKEFQASVPEWRRWQLFNVHYVLSDRELDGPGLRRLFPQIPPQGEEKTLYLYAVTDPFPRAWVVHQLEVVRDRVPALQRISQDEFDLRRTAVVAHPLEIAPPTYPVEGSRAQVTFFSAEALELEVQAVADGLLVLSEIDYPGWHASVDGQPAQTVTANGVLRGIPITAGLHRVRIWYAPVSFQIGTLITLTTLVGGGIIILGILLISRYTRLTRLHLQSPSRPGVTESVIK
ncbi:MAG: YfhO family protein [Anaerolineae bacterium]